MNTGNFHSAVVIATVKDLWIAGVTQREIGQRVGISKNTVPGIVRRLGLPKRPKDLSRKPSGWAARKIQLAKPPAPDPVGPVGDFPGPGKCRFIAGPVSPKFQCCGHTGYPFCEFHSVKVYAPKVDA
jgi:hypothetical protein